MKRFIQTVVALLPVLAAGCLPNATWLPDSSGFVYTGGLHKDTLYLYDLEKKEPLTLVEKGAGPAWPAVSADGKHIAMVLRLFQTAAFFPCLGRGSVTLKVIVFDRDGKESHRSPKLEWADRNPGYQDKTAPQAFWVPGQDKLLICSDGKTGIYDLKTKSVVKHDRIVSTFGASPIFPDGKGFLAFDTEKGALVAVDWDGKEKKIELSSKDALNNFSDRDAWPLAGMIYYPLLHASHWDGSTAVVSWNDLRVKIDPDKGVAAFEQFKPSLTADKKLIQQEVRLSAGGVVRAVELSARYKKDESPGDLYFGRYRVEILKPATKEPKTLMDNAGFFMIYPSPDGKKAVVKCSKTLNAIFTESKPDQDMLFLIDGAGNVADTIDLTK